jgi:hypothetical protein
VVFIYRITDRLMSIGGQGDPREWDQMDFRRFWKSLKPEPLAIQAEA